MMNRAHVAGMMALAAVLAVPLAAQQNLGREGTSWNWDGAVQSGQWFRVHNLNGPVNVTASSDGSVHVRAQKRLHDGGEASAVHYAVVRSSSGVTICALWRDDATCDEDGSHSHGYRNGNSDNDRTNVEVVFNIQVPAGVRTGAKVVNGDVNISGVNSAVNAHTINGNVRAEHVGAPATVKTINGNVTVNASGGPIIGETVNGNVDATLGANGSSEMSFKTVNGTININTPANFNADVSLSTLSGSIESRYALDFDRRRHHADGKVGNGGADVSAKTINGSITLR